MVSSFSEQELVTEYIPALLQFLLHFNMIPQKVACRILTLILDS